ncbi:MAG: hypothetical protein L3J16_03125, partial [Anaerolineales bacterium]|nr:hypothetical protein [Anaerolineales bacterium]
MKTYRWLSVLIAIILISTACTPGQLPGGETATLPSPQVSITSAPDALTAMNMYLDAFRIEDYTTMYRLLSKVSQDAFSEEEFTKKYKDALNAMSLKSMDMEVLSTLTNPFSAQSAFRVTYHTVLAGDIERDIVTNLTLENGEWRIQWDEGMILPELLGGNRLAMDYRSPSRGNIYDRHGNPIATQADAVALGIIPGQINEDSEATLLNQLSKVTEYTPQQIAALYEYAGADWYIPVGETTAEEAQRLLNANLGGLYITPYSARYYYNGGIAPQTVGYLISISPEELESYLRQGYGGDERVGYSGLEKWGEKFLTGTHGGTLYVVNPEGTIITRLAQSDPKPAASLNLTLDRDLQLNTQKALRGFRGAAVVLERDTGRILAMASSPGFDPNFFEPTNTNNQGLGDLLNNTNQPLVNRATQGQYPLGSVFKVITMASALSSGLYTADKTYECGYHFVELSDRVLDDWTFEYCQNEIAASRIEDPDNPLTPDRCYT